MTADPSATRDGQNVALVHDLLREAILRGEILPGVATSQVVLARRFGVTRTPLREALRLLQREGLVLSEPNRRIRIADFSLSDLEGLYSMRIALEAVAIRASVPTLGPADFGELEGLMAQMKHYLGTGDVDRMDIPHKEFHTRLIAGAGPRMTAAIEELFDHGQRYRRAYAAVAAGQWKVREAEHRAVLDAAAAGDGRLAAEHLARHYLHTANAVINQLDADHDPVVLRAVVETVAPGASDLLRRRHTKARR